MKYGDIKLETLKLMFINEGNDLTIEDFEAYEQDDTYKNYLVNMPGSINRCFPNLNRKGFCLPNREHYQYRKAL